MQLSTRRSANHRLLAGVLFVAAMAPFLGTLAFGYVMDDTTVIRWNADVNGWSSLWRVWAHPFGGENSPYFGLYRPLTMMVFAFVWNAGGQWALWFHVLALLMHAVATVLVWRVARLGVGNAPAVLAALWFGAHPVHVEAVANVSNSSEVLVAIWTCLLTLYLARIVRGQRPITWLTASGAAALYLAAFLSKESGAVAPILALLWVWCCRRDESLMDTSLTPYIARWWRILVAWALVAVVVMILRDAVLGGPVTGRSIAVPGLDDLSVGSRIRAMLSLGPDIVRLLVWPAQINPHYGPTTFPVSGATTLALLTLVVVVLAHALGLRLATRGDRRFLAAVLWVLVAFLPASNILVATGQILAERTLYVPSIGITLMAAIAIDAIWIRAPLSPRWRAARAAAVGLCALVIAAAATRSGRWSKVWRNHDTLFAQMIVADGAGYRGYWLSGLEARRVGRVDSAVVLFVRAHDLYPSDRALMIDYIETLMTAGNYHAARGDTAAAAEYYRQGSRVAPQDSAFTLRLKTLQLDR